MVNNCHQSKCCMNRWQGDNLHLDLMIVFTQSCYIIYQISLCPVYPTKIHLIMWANFYVENPTNSDRKWFSGLKLPFHLIFENGLWAVACIQGSESKDESLFCKCAILLHLYTIKTSICLFLPQCQDSVQSSKSKERMVDFFFI